MIDDDRLDVLVLARIGRGAKVGVSDVKKALAPLLSGALAPGEIRRRLDERIVSLAERDLLHRRPLGVTDAGVDHLKAALGVARVPDWKTVRQRIAPALALGVDPAGPLVATSEAVIATVLARRIGVGDGPRTIAAAVDAWIAERLGMPLEKFTSEGLRAKVLVHLGAGSGKDVGQLAARLAAGAVRAAKPGPDPLRAALVQQWLASSGATAAPVAAATVAPAVAPAAAPTEPDLPALAAAVRTAAARADGRFGRKVFIAAVWRTLTGDPRFADLSLDRFKQLLVAANRDGLLELTRADLVGAMDPGLVAASEIDDLGSTFHFVTGDGIGG